ncbi:hypothetical protein HSX11_11000 [Oxalobacteraceae bacterium]|nr:hypothetical protein [Oxalobacteraceae bacterium]
MSDRVYKLKDGTLLLMVGMLSSAAAWAFWHFLGVDAIGVLATIVLIVLTADNLRLRRKLRDSHR